MEECGLCGGCLTKEHKCPDKLNLKITSKNLMILSGFCRDALENYYETWKAEFLIPEKAVKKEVFSRILSDFFQQALQQDLELRKAVISIKPCLDEFNKEKSLKRGDTTKGDGKR